MIEKLVSIFAVPLGFVLDWIYENIAFHNYGFAIIIFTLIMKFALLPLMIKQQKSTVLMRKMQPKLDELKRKYKDDPQRINVETLKLYQENGNPASGCFTALIQMPILLSLFYVISKPLTYMKHMTTAQINELAKTLGSDVGPYYQIAVVAKNKILNMNFLDLDLSKIPDLGRLFNGNGTTEYFVLLILPILVAVATFLATRVTPTIDVDSKDKSGSYAKYMMYVAPIMVGMFAFKVPAGLSIYWIVDNFCRMLQQIYINKYVTLED